MKHFKTLLFTLAITSSLSMSNYSFAEGVHSSAAEEEVEAEITMTINGENVVMSNFAHNDLHSDVLGRMQLTKGKDGKPIPLQEFRILDTGKEYKLQYKLKGNTKFTSVSYDYNDAQRPLFADPKKHLAVQEQKKTMLGKAMSSLPGTRKFNTGEFGPSGESQGKVSGDDKTSEVSPRGKYGELVVGNNTGSSSTSSSGDGKAVVPYYSPGDRNFNTAEFGPSGESQGNSQLLLPSPNATTYYLGALSKSLTDSNKQVVTQVLRGDASEINSVLGLKLSQSEINRFKQSAQWVVDNNKLMGVEYNGKLYAIKVTPSSTVGSSFENVKPQNKPSVRVYNKETRTQANVPVNRGRGGANVNPNRGNSTSSGNLTYDANESIQE
jgi:hypothetical protein